ncbi:hypothetical protein [Methylovulum psychrotolerans]|nr:hypothetical protein [Methylovulum psychrotolerans]
MLSDYYTAVCNYFGDFFLALWDTLKNLYNAFIDFWIKVFLWSGTFFTAIGESLKNFAATLWVYFVNVFKSLWYALIDLPLALFKLLLDPLLWILNWAATSCSYCLGLGSGGGNGSSSLPSALASAWAGLSPTILYLINATGVQQCLQVLTCALVIWAAVKQFKLLWSVIFK